MPNPFDTVLWSPSFHWNKTPTRTQKINKIYISLQLMTCEWDIDPSWHDYLLCKQYNSPTTKLISIRFLIRLWYTHILNVK